MLKVAVFNHSFGCAKCKTNSVPPAFQGFQLKGLSDPTHELQLLSTHQVSSHPMSHPPDTCGASLRALSEKDHARSGRGHLWTAVLWPAGTAVLHHRWCKIACNRG